MKRNADLGTLVSKYVRPRGAQVNQHHLRHSSAMIIT